MSFWSCRFVRSEEEVDFGLVDVAVLRIRHVDAGGQDLLVGHAVRLERGRADIARFQVRGDLAVSVLDVRGDRAGLEPDAQR